MSALSSPSGFKEALPSVLTEGGLGVATTQVTAGPGPCDCSMLAGDEEPGMDLPFDASIPARVMLQLVVTYAYYPQVIAGRKC